MNMLKQIEIDNLDKILEELSGNKIALSKEILYVLLKNACFYPASGTDTTPIVYLENFQSFVYCDYVYKQDQWMNEIKTELEGYSLIFSQSLRLTSSFDKHFFLKTEERIREISYEIEELYIKENSIFEQAQSQNSNDLDQIKNKIEALENEKSELTYRYKNNYLLSELLKKLKNFSHLSIWQNENRIFSVIYVSSEAVHCYEQIFNKFKINPKVISIIQPGHTMGGNWTNFFDSNSDFLKTVSKGTIPHYMLLGCAGENDNYHQINYDYSKFKKISRSERVIPSFNGDTHYVYAVISR